MPPLRSLLDRVFGGAQSARLQLAAAHLDLGDKAAARKILEEIIATGTAEEKRQAEMLLARIS